jgi:hypothetical protein
MEFIAAHTDLTGVLESGFYDTWLRRMMTNFTANITSPSLVRVGTQRLFHTAHICMRSARRDCSCMLQAMHGMAGLMSAILWHDQIFCITLSGFMALECALPAIISIS